ncbi:MAG: autotransporter-associated beta strand repeat-containing protein [Kiritimatiellae bacterium]|jgi:T5SS/PEP-CTERM-associated repeat protein/autotransporter-associated beta strand protein|nr:autotransporter-associated beta strand repeat-containing protein [Kiritimatiellia bacterium]
MASPSVGGETVFKLNQQVWTNDRIYSWTGAGGKLTFTNGTLRARELEFAPAPAGMTTNLIATMSDVTCEVGIADFAASQSTFAGGSLQVANEIQIGMASKGIGTVFLDNDVVCNVASNVYIGLNSGTTGELVNINGQFRKFDTGGFYVGKEGQGTLKLQGGTFDVDGWFVIGHSSAGVGYLDVQGGENTMGVAGADSVHLGYEGKGTLCVGGGSTTINQMFVGYEVSAHGEMIVTNGLWKHNSHIWVGFHGYGSLLVSGGEMRVNGVFCIGRNTGSTGVVTVTGGFLDASNNGEVRLGGEPNSQGRLTLSGGVLKAKYVKEYKADADSAILFDGGTLQAAEDGALIRAVDDIRLTSAGLVVDSNGYDIRSETVLQDAAGEAGSLTKKGAGTLILSAGRMATGAVSVEAGTLVVSNTLAVVGGGTVSTIDGTLALANDRRMTLGAGAAVGGIGTVSRLTLQNNSVFARDKADGAVTPLVVNDCVADDRLTIALTGYALQDLKTSLPLIDAPTAFIDLSKITVTLNGQIVPALQGKYTTVGSRQVLSVSYMDGTLLMFK